MLSGTTKINKHLITIKLEQVEDSAAETISMFRRIHNANEQTLLKLKETEAVKDTLTAQIKAAAVQLQMVRDDKDTLESRLVQQTAKLLNSKKDEIRRLRARVQELESSPPQDCIHEVAHIPVKAEPKKRKAPGVKADKALRAVESAAAEGNFCLFLRNNLTYLPA